MTGLDFPEVSPIMFTIGPIAIRWYSMAYLFGIVAAWFLVRRNIAKYKLPLSYAQLEDLVFYVTLGIILGGRLGYVIFYGVSDFLYQPWLILQVWKGGMSFHGGVLGVVLAAWLFAKKNQRPFLSITDLIPIGAYSTIKSAAIS